MGVRQRWPSRSRDWRGAPNRSLVACGSTFRRTRRCASAMRPFIRHCYHDRVSNVVPLFPTIQTRRTITMISRADARRAAIHLIDALGPEAAKAAHERSSEMLTLGDARRYAVWAMILDAIEDILDQEPRMMGRVH